MPQQETAEKAAVARLLAAVDNLNAALMDVHRHGLEMGVGTPVIEVQEHGRTFRTVQMFVKVSKPIQEYPPQLMVQKK